MKSHCELATIRSRSSQTCSSRDSPQNLNVHPNKEKNAYRQPAFYNCKLTVTSGKVEYHVPIKFTFFTCLTHRHPTTRCPSKSKSKRNLNLTCPKCPSLSIRQIGHSRQAACVKGVSRGIRVRSIKRQFAKQIRPLGNEFISEQRDEHAKTALLVQKMVMPSLGL